MRKLKLLSATALIAMLTLNCANANDSFDNIPQEDVEKAIVKVLKVNPKIVYDALNDFHKVNGGNEEYTEENFSPLEKKIAEALKANPLLVVGALQIYDQEQQQKQLEKEAENYKKYAKEISKADLFVGPENSKYTLVEFFDFSCGFCKQMAPRLENIIKKNPDVKVVFKPLSFLSPMSEVAAKAAVAANNQGKYLEMYSKLMKANRLDESIIEKIAEEIGLDMDKYKKDIASSKTKDILDSNKAVAEKVKIKSVPTLVLNTLPLYAVEEVQIQHAIDLIKNTY